MPTVSLIQRDRAMVNAVRFLHWNDPLRSSSALSDKQKDRIVSELPIALFSLRVLEGLMWGRMYI